MGKRKICKIVFVILSIFLCVVFYESFGICIAYKKRPEVSNTIKKETQNDSWNERSENMERAVIIEKNPEALLQRVRLIRNAKEDIILSTFAFQSDESGKLILGALHDAADRGVHVRLLVDGMESWVDMEGNPYFYGLSSHENVEIKLYNKANPLKPWKMMGRMHDKYLIADGRFLSRLCGLAVLLGWQNLIEPVAHIPQNLYILLYGSQRFRLGSDIL